MTARQQRRLEQKLARKVEKRTAKTPQTLLPVTEPLAVAEEIPLISVRKLQANRANAQLSTGARSEAGKQVVSQNATVHGLCGKFRVLPNESQADFDQLLASFLRVEHPEDQAEVEFVEQMAQAMWLSRRSARLQNDCFEAIDSGTPEEARVAKQDLALYLRYQTTHERAFIRFSGELRKRRNERRKVERGFVSQKHREAQEQRKDAQQLQRNELQQLRKNMEILKQERYRINTRLAAARAERLEIENSRKKALQPAESPAPTLAAAA